MNRGEASADWLHRYAILLAFCALCLVFAGGLVTSKGAGLAVADWPLSYGKLMPEGWFRAENVRAEHSHRMLAGTVGIMTLVLAIWVHRKEPRRWVQVFAWATFGGVVFQALLGAVIIKFLRPLAGLMSHAVTGQTFFCLTVCMALFTSPSWRREGSRIQSEAAGSLHGFCLALLAAVYLQLLLGALMRHTESGLAIPDFPLAYGKLIPPMDATSIHNINVDRFHAGFTDLAAGQILVHFLHRVWAGVVCVAALAVAWRVFKSFRDSGAILFPMLTILILLPTQVVLGAMAVLTAKQPHVATTHVAVGASILACSVVLCLQSFRWVVRPAAVRQTVSAPRLASREVVT